MKLDSRYRQTVIAIAVYITIFPVIGSAYTSSTSRGYELIDNATLQSGGHCLLKVSVSVSNLTFDSREKAILSGVIMNSGEHPIVLTELVFSYANLSKRSRDDQTRLKRSETFSAGFDLPKSLVAETKVADRLPAGESLKFEVALADLSWTDTVSSVFVFDSRQPITVVPAGRYNLFLSIQRRSPDDKGGEFESLLSNQIEVVVQ
jgi:hypothetical protein